MKAFVVSTATTLCCVLSAPAAAIKPEWYGTLEIALAHTTEGYAVNPSTNDSGQEQITDPENGTYLENNWSYFGAKGREQLNKDIAIIYQLEVAVQDSTIDGVADPISSRNTYLGFDTTWGTFYFGREYSAFYQVIDNSNIDIFDNTNAWLAQLMPGEDRHSSIVSYYSPTLFDWFNVSGTMLMEDEDQSSDYPFAVAASVGDPDLTKRPFYFTAAYNKDIESFRGYRLAGQVAVGPAWIGAMWQRSKDQTYNNLQGNSYYVNARYNLMQLGAKTINLKVMYGQDRAGLGDYFQSVVTATDELSSVRVRQITLGADYHASESAIFYAYWVNYEGNYRDDNTKISLATENVYTLGLRYYF